MEVQRGYRETWTIPQRCCVCGEPVTDGKPHKASFELSKTYTPMGGNSTQVTTTTASILFPRCERCVRATSTHSNASGAGIVLGLIIGFVAVGLIGQQADWMPFACVSGIVVWVGVAIGLGYLLERIMGSQFDEDMWRRTKLSSTPVTIAKATETAFAPELKFKFANDAYGEAFSATNP
jgi:hypothetical protein